MRLWIKTFALFALLLGSFGRGSAIATIPPENQGNFSHPNSQFGAIPSQSLRQSVQFDQSLGQQGECRAIRRETHLYGANSVRALTGVFLNENDIVQLLENEIIGQRLIFIAIPSLNVAGYVETSELKPCIFSLRPPVPFSNIPDPPTQQELNIPQQKCKIRRETYLYRDPDIGSSRLYYLNVGLHVEIQGDHITGWHYVDIIDTGDVGWVKPDTIGCR